MKKINFKILIITSIICLLPIVIGLIYYNDLPSKVAIHFDMNGKPNSYWNKGLFVFLLPLMMTLIQVIICVSVDLDKKSNLNKKASIITKSIIPIVTLILYSSTVYYSLGNSIDFRILVMIIIGSVFILIGNYLPQNTKLQRYIYIISGVLFVLSVFFNSIVSVVIVILSIIIVLITSLMR